MIDSSMTWITVSGIAFIIITAVMIIKKYSSKFDFILQYVAYFSFVVFIFMHMNWYAVNYYLRYIALIISLATLLLSIKKIKKLPFFIKKTVVRWIFSAVVLAVLAAFSYFNALCFLAFGYDEEPVNLEFPFKDGLYTAYNGGNGEISPLMNYHMSYAQWQREGYEEGMKYAVDIVKINKFGFFSNGILPRDAEKYETFGETVYSPCDGVVSDVSKSAKDLVPFTHPVDYGNRVVIKSGDVFILMVHLKEGSIEVKIGDEVTAGQPIAKAGNSGMTLYPHLHIQATRDHWLYGRAVPILFDNRFLMKNGLVIKKP